jgi:hypothetical protein
MIAQLIHKAVTANKELVDALEKLSEVLGVTGNGTLFEGEHLRLTHDPAVATSNLVNALGELEIQLSPPEKKGKKKTGQAGLKNRAKGASMNRAKDKSIWPFEKSRHLKREPSLTIQKELKSIIGASRSTGITRGELTDHIRTILPAHMKRKQNKSGFKAWQSSLGNLLRNYTAAGYLDCAATDTNRNHDVFTLGG